MRFRFRLPVSSAALALVLAAGGVTPAKAAVTIADPVAQFVTESGSVAKMYAALDPSAQVYLVVWSTFTQATKGQFLNTAGRAISSPFPIASAAGYARVVRGANEFLVTYQKGNPGQRWGRTLKYVNGAAVLGPEFYITAAYVDSDAGMVYVPSAQHYLITSWTGTNGFHSFVTGVRADGTITIPTTLVTGSASDTASPEIACDFATSKCLIVGYGDNKYTWGRYINPTTGAMLSSLLTIDSGSTQEDHCIEWDATTQRFLLVYVRNRAGIAAKRIYGNGTIDPTAATVLTGGYGQLGMSYNAGTNSFLLAFKDSAGNNAENCWVQEFNGDGVAVAGQLIKVSTQTTAGNALPVTVANASRLEYLFVQTRNYNAGDAGVLAATTPGSTVSPPPPPPPPPPSSTTSATTVTAVKADFNGDSKADLLWERTDGLIAVWNMSGVNAIGMANLNDTTSADPTWKIVGSGDLDGNGKPEIIWQRDNGDVCAWAMDGELLSSWGFTNPVAPDPGWRVVAVADMNGDSKADLIFQRTDGTLAIWYMNGLNAASMVTITPANPGDANWRVVGAGDMNGDGKPDLIFRHQTMGTLAVWFMNGATRQSWTYLTPNKASGLDWTVRSVIDLNGDGKTDLVWQNTNGAVAVWLMNGTKAASMPALNPSSVAAGWTLSGPK
jgi:hypothetical protein